MIQPRILIIFPLVLFFLGGCVPVLQNRTDATGKTPGPDATSVSTAATPYDAKPKIGKDGTGTAPAKRAATATIQTRGSRTAHSYPKTAATASAEEKAQALLDEALDFCQVSQDFWQKGELENALESLDQAYSLILRIDTNNTPRLIQEKEDLRFMISKRILEIYASRNIVVNGHHNAIPLDLNAHVHAEIDSFASKSRENNFFIRSYRRSGLYRPYIVKALREAGLPEELSWLPLIESGFRVNALSSARALGLWQFISSTGYKFGLKRTMYVDERLDPIKSTHAAIAYLKELHQIFGDWTTVLAAYNCGEGRVLRVIRSQNINYLDNFWDLYQKLPNETARYVPRFLATLHILKNPAKYGLDETDPLPPMDYETISVSRRLHLSDIAKASGIDEGSLKTLNPELRYNIVPGDDEYTLRVPKGTSATLLADIGKIPEYQTPVRTYAIYQVRSGDTLSSIAKRHRTNVSRIMQANNLRSHRIVAGKRLKIPMKGVVEPARIEQLKNVDTTATTHRVQRGDSLWTIARRYGTTTQKIQAANGLKDTQLHISQVLKIPGRHAAPQPASGNGFRTYKVKRGDSPFRIAYSHKMPLEKFLRINSLTPRSRIYPGQQVYVD